MRVNNQLKYANDPHLFFTFNNIYSRDWNLFIENTNKGGGTKIVASPDKTVSFATPDYQNNTYYLGTTKKQKTFKHTVAADGLTPAEIQQILQWLKIGEIGFLVYDINPFWGWDVVVTDVGEVSQYEASDSAIIEFSVEFKTINDWHARSVYDAKKQLNVAGWIDTNDDNNLTSHTIANEFGIPEIVCGDNGTIYLPQVCDEHSFVKFNWTITDPQQTTIKYQNRTIFDYSFKGKTANINSYIVTYFSQYGFTLSGNHIVEDTDWLMDDSSGTSDLLILDNKLPQDVTQNSTDPDFKTMEVGSYRCTIYSHAVGTPWTNIALKEQVIPGDIYGVKIEFWLGEEQGIATYSYGDITLPIQKIYVGASNILQTLPIDASGNITVIKHASL